MTVGKMREAARAVVLRWKSGLVLFLGRLTGRPGQPSLPGMQGADGYAVFRAMRSDSDGQPRLGRAARDLGVRIEGRFADLPVAADGSVRPGTGGMSVAVDDARHLPKPRRPRSLGGEGRDPVFSLQSGAFPESLSLHVDRRPHALVEPALPCLLNDYERALASTRPSWRKTHD
jgi:hypothetical protein